MSFEDFLTWSFFRPRRLSRREPTLFSVSILTVDQMLWIHIGTISSFFYQKFNIIWNIFHCKTAAVKPSAAELLSAITQFQMFTTSVLHGKKSLQSQNLPLKCDSGRQKASLLLLLILIESFIGNLWGRHIKKEWKLADTWLISEVSRIYVLFQSKFCNENMVLWRSTEQ